MGALARAAVGAALWLLLDVALFDCLHLTLANNGLFGIEALRTLMERRVLEGRRDEVGTSAGGGGDGGGLSLPRLAPSDLNRATFGNLTAHNTRPVLIPGAFDASRADWTVDMLASLLPGEHLQLDERIYPEPSLSQQPRASFAKRLRLYQQRSVSQVNQVLYAGLHNDDIRRLLEAMGAAAVTRVFETSGYGGLLHNLHPMTDWPPPLAVTINVYRTGGHGPGQASGVSWHSHLLEAPTTFQMAGAKRWRLVAPEWTPLMRPEPSFKGAVLFTDKSRYSYFGSASDPDRGIPHVGAIPQFTVEMRPGDVMFNPAGWWHATLNPVVASGDEESDVISVVFSHPSVGHTMMRTHLWLWPVTAFTVVYIVLEEVLLKRWALVAAAAVGALAARRMVPQRAK